MSDKFDSRDKLCHLIDALVDDVAEMSLEELRLEMEEDGIDGEAVALHYRSVFFAAAKKVGQDKLAEARRKIEERRKEPPRPLSRIHDVDRRKVLDRMMRDNSNGHMTLAARSSSGGIDPDLESAIEDWEELGCYDDEKDRG